MWNYRQRFKKKQYHDQLERRRQQRTLLATIAVLALTMVVVSMAVLPGIPSPVSVISTYTRSTVKGKCSNTELPTEQSYTYDLPINTLLINSVLIYHGAAYSSAVRFPFVVSTNSAQSSTNGCTAMLT